MVNVDFVLFSNKENIKIITKFLSNSHSMDSQSRAQSTWPFSTRVMGCNNPGNWNAGSGVELPGHCLELRTCEVKVTC